MPSGFTRTHCPVVALSPGAPLVQPLSLSSASQVGVGVSATSCTAGAAPKLYKPTDGTYPARRTSS